MNAPLKLFQRIGKRFEQEKNQFNWIVIGPVFPPEILVKRMTCHILGVAALFVSADTSMAATQNAALDLTQLSIEELMNVKIFSATKNAQRLFDTAAAAFVITREDIRRSGATSIPDALRMVPGVHVAQISASEWAISIRGLNNRFANNLLVLIDGRSVYAAVLRGLLGRRMYCWRMSRVSR